MIFAKVAYCSPHLNLWYGNMLCVHILWSIGLINWVGTQQRLLHQVHLHGLRRVDYMRRCIYCLLPIIVGNGEEEAIWCCWLVNLVLPVGENKRGFGAAGWRCLVVVVKFELIVWHPCVIFHLCGFSLLIAALAGVQKTVVFSSSVVWKKNRQ